MRIGLLGFGTVGKGVYELTSARADMQVVRVLCRQKLQLPDAQVTHDFNDILSDDSIDTVVEAIGGLHPAFEYVKAAIEAASALAAEGKYIEACSALNPVVAASDSVFNAVQSFYNGEYQALIDLGSSLDYDVNTSSAKLLAMTMQMVVALCPRSRERPAKAELSISKLVIQWLPWRKLSIFSFCWGSANGKRNTLPCGP